MMMMMVMMHLFIGSPMTCLSGEKKKKKYKAVDGWLVGWLVCPRLPRSSQHISYTGIHRTTITTTNTNNQEQEEEEDEEEGGGIDILTHTRDSNQVSVVCDPARQRNDF